jgi:hypothetical protein
MANAPQGTFQFAGVFAEGEFQVNRSGSTLPDTITAQFNLNSVIPQYGDIRVAYGNQSILIPGCRVVRAEVQGGTGGRYREVQFQDRRWRWQYAYAFGNINIMYGVGYSVLTNRLPAIEAINFLLGIVGESNAQFFPLNAFGSVKFDSYGNAEEFRMFSDPQHFDGRTVAECLDEMLTNFNARVYLGWDNRVRIFVPGFGANIPNDLRVMDYTVSVTPPVVPETVVFEFRENQFQNDFVLEAVGYLWDTKNENPSQSLVPLSALNYGPINPQTNAIDWSFADPPLFKRIQDKRIQELCRRTIFKLYRIDSSVRVSLLNPFENSDTQGLGLEFNPEDFILDDALWIDHPMSVNLRQPNKPAPWVNAGINADYHRLTFNEESINFTVMGYFADRTLHQKNNNVVAAANYQMTGREFVDYDVATLRTQFPNSVYNGSFEFDAEQKLVKLSNALVFINRNPAGAVQVDTYLPAKLILRGLHKLRRRADMDFIRTIIPYRLNSPLSVPGMVEKITIDDTLYFFRDSGQSVGDITSEIQPYFSNYVASKTVSESATVPMKGFAFDVSPDGNIPNVTFSRNSAGQCTTVVQWQKENPTIFPMYDELSNSQRSDAIAQAVKKNQRRQAGQLQAFHTRKGIT